MGQGREGETERLREGGREEERVRAKCAGTGACIWRRSVPILC